MLTALVAILSLCVVHAAAAVSWTATPFNPASVPLAVRSPYLSTWLNQGSGTALNADWPRFWTGSILGWAGFVKVDGTAYNFLGAPAVPNTRFQKSVQKSLTFTSTQSTFVMTSGPVDLTVNFLSPVEPTDLVKQSLPFSYMAITAKSNDGQSHDVQVYSDISAEWVTGDNSLTANWSTTATASSIFHQVQLESQTVFGEIGDHIQQGSAYYAVLNAVGTTFQTGQDVVVRAQFINNGVLANTKDTTFRAVENDWPVFAFAHDLGTVSGSSAPVVFAVGHVRDPAIEYIVAGGTTQNRSSFFWSQFSTVSAAIDSFLGDFGNALGRANAFDAKVQSDASAISADYASIVALSIRQAFGATEITASRNSDGSINASDILMFMKVTGHNVNTVDVIFPSWPVFLYTNPALGKYLLLPLFEYQASGQYPNKWSVHDMGASYPKALGHNDGGDEAMPVEESGNMLIMTLSYVQKTNDQSLLTTYYNLLDQWTQFLITDSLIPANQISTDDFAGSLANQTNLAIKGLVGIKAMSQIASLTGKSSVSSNYSSIAASYVTQWQTFATSKTGAHLTLAYDMDSTWGLSYNLFGDKLLGLNLFPQSVYEMQTAWYSTHANSFGVPLDTRHTYTKSDWSIWTAAISTTTAVRDLFITAVHNYAADGLSSQPLGDWYETLDGSVEGFRARPVVGGHLALLAF
ncbi:hypothetical protein PHLGIDRAFT_112413 [Phlebiopsis gigantea 11061_1 CR5-6]|uniref:DUF1793-domain-containing protein n=1 Tax=Phlebiopsis gigantea (strain 11061_1 CR5-6) TaxID=745531 RepID=A0A0C3PB32_PHLG1|nr:hypothetical protein PHLGIDRAFT_112413 [Phlebiopsis gigantea 11061_1 CR5-6]